MNLELKKFDMRTIKDDKVVVLIGRRETGKSFLTRDLLYYHQDIPVGITISGTEDANSFYSSIMPSIFIHGAYKPEIIHNTLARQKKILAAIQKETADKKLIGMTPQDYVKSGDCSIDPRSFLILDDCLYDKAWVNNTDIRCLFMNGRHYFTMFIITMQYALGIPPNLRTNIDYVFILRENYASNRKRIFEQYAGMFPSYEIFCQVMDQCTEDYECLVINNNAKSNKLEDQVFWYKADSHENFQLGHPSFWKYHVENFNPDLDNDGANYNPNSLKKKKNNTIINVKKGY
jgi:hypothetical protein